MSPDSYPTDRNRTDAVLDHLIVVQAENAALTDRCAELIDIADAACDERDAAHAALTVLRGTGRPRTDSRPS